MNKISLFRTAAYLGCLSLGLLSSCSEDPFELSSSDAENVSNEAITEAYLEDVDDMSALAVAAEPGSLSGSREASNGRGEKPDDSRFTCATVTLEFANDNTQLNPHGFITIDFGAGCTDPRGNVRKGKIVVEFLKRRFSLGSKIVTELQGYSVNGISIEGVRTVTNVTESLAAPKFNITLTGGKVTWPDGTFATRETNHFRTWVRNINPMLDEIRVYGAAAGSNRRGKIYQVEVSSDDPLVYKRECALSARIFMAVSGTRKLTADGKLISIDYGDGACDRLVTITINGRSREIEVKP
ncbi:MAG: hypothetical protein ACK5DD_03320 [Cyclobacteriaceae bacterium]|jgi:hypothetical protein